MPTAGEYSASSHASVDLMATATPSLEPASVSQAGGHRTARSSVCAGWPAPTVTLSQGSASAPRAGGVGDAASDAPATSHPVPKTQAGVSAGLGFGGHCVNIIVTACMGTATLLMGIAAATLAIRAGAVGILVLPVITDLSADTGKRNITLRACDKV